MKTCTHKKTCSRIFIIASFIFEPRSSCMVQAGFNVKRPTYSSRLPCNWGNMLHNLILVVSFFFFACLFVCFLRAADHTKAVSMLGKFSTPQQPAALIFNCPDLKQVKELSPDWTNCHICSSRILLNHKTLCCAVLCCVCPAVLCCAA